MLTVPSLPLILGPSLLLTAVKLLPHDDRHGARPTALHILALGTREQLSYGQHNFGASGQIWCLMSREACWSNHNAAPEY